MMQNDTWKKVANAGEREANTASNRVAVALEEIGAEITNEHSTDHETIIDYQTPLPGEQPIASTVTVDSGGIQSSAIRLGVLKDMYPTHPTNDKDLMERLARTISGANPPQGSSISVDYGDNFRNPRPHVRIRTHGALSSISKEFPDISQIQTGEEKMSAEEYTGFLERMVSAMRREYRGEWA